MLADPVVQGAKIMILGMGTVFAFLSLMVAILYVQAWVVSQWFPAPPASGPGTGPGEGGEDPGVVPAIVAAVRKHRNSTRS